MNFAEEFEPIEFVGTAISEFQSEPLTHDKDGKILPPLSDWEFELSKNLQGKHSGIKNRQNAEDMPHFLELKEVYIKRAEELGQNMFCFSIDWGRLCPKEGVFDEKVMTEYIKVLALIRIHNQEPLLTLHHFTVPFFLLKINSQGEITKGGWEHPDALAHFKFYVEHVVAFLNDEAKLRAIFEAEGYNEIIQDRFIREGLVTYIVTLNEPAVIGFMGYVTGLFPPFNKWRFYKADKVMRTLVKAHDIAREELKKLGNASSSSYRKPQIGIGYTWQFFDGLVGPIAQIVSRHYNNIFERDGSHSDFLGLHYYFRQSFLFFNKRRKKRDYGDQPEFGDIYPIGILTVLKNMNKLYPNKPIFVSEIGFADTKGSRRPFWLAETIKHVIEARKQGLPIKALILWSIADNFEWNLGMNVAKFGLFSENQIKKPLAPEEGRMHSWQVWQKATTALRKPSPEAIADLEDFYEKVKNRYYEEVGIEP
jgi:beta-glucosidase